jgi:hypothetical protein
LRGQAADVLHSVPATATCEEDIVGNLKGHYGNHQLAVAYRAQLKARIWLNVKPFQ